MGLEGFSRTLNAVYGRFDVRPLDSGSVFGVWKRAESLSLDCATVITENVHISRRDRALKPEFEDALFVVFQQEGRQRIDHCGHSITLSPKDLSIGNAVEACDLVSDRRSKVFVVQLHASKLLHPEALSSLCGRHLSGAAAKVRLLSDVLLSIVRASTDDDVFAEDEDYMYELIGAAARGLQADSTASNYNPQRLLMDMRQFVLLNIHDPDLRLGKLASALNLSRRSLYRVFEHHGVTPSSWLWSVRLDAAKDRLRAELWRTCSITDVAYSVGFNDSAHFSRAFRSRYGMSPRQFRHADKSIAARPLNNLEGIAIS